MVGLTDLGEAAWEVEQVMNRGWSRSAGDAGLLELISGRPPLFPAGSRSCGRQVTASAGMHNASVDFARRLKAGDEPARIVEPAPETRAKAPAHSRATRGSEAS